MTVGLEHYLIVSVVLFCLGLLGVITVSYTHLTLPTICSV